MTSRAPGWSGGVGALASPVDAPLALEGAEAAPPVTEAELGGLRRRSAIACVLAGLVLVVLDAAVANVALPAIASALGVAPAAAVRVVSAYQMALVMALLPCAVLGESLGYRRVYTAGIALFVAASAACAAAPSLSLLVAARFVQGLGGAAVMSLGVALLRRVVPSRQLGAALGWNTLAVALASAAGPALGALILSRASWPWLFAAPLPFGALVLAATRALPVVPGSGRRLDPVSVVLHGAAFAALVVGAELAAARGLLAAGVLGAGGLALLALVRREAPRSAPMIPLDLLRRRSFRVSVIASVCCFVGQSAALVSLPFHLQDGLGHGVLETGARMTAWPLAVALVAPLAGRLANRVSGAALCALGGGLLALGLAPIAAWPLDDGPLLALLALAGAGFGLFQIANNRNLLLSAPRSRSAAAGGLQSTARLTGQTLGAALMTLLFTTTPLELAPRLGLGVAALLTLGAGVVSLGRGAREGSSLRGPPPRS